MARSLAEEELPVLDRPLRFAVHRGARGSVKAASLDELRELLERPWSPGEERQSSPRPRHEGRRGDRHRARPGGPRHRRHR
jgi:hypothetical protein